MWYSHGAISEANHILSHSLGVPVYSVEEQETGGGGVQSVRKCHCSQMDFKTIL